MQAGLAEGVAAGGGALEHAVGDEDDELVGGDRRPPRLARRMQAVEPEDRTVAAVQRAQPAVGVPDQQRMPAAQPHSDDDGAPTRPRALMKMS